MKVLIQLLIVCSLMATLKLQACERIDECGNVTAEATTNVTASSSAVAAATSLLSIDVNDTVTFDYMDDEAFVFGNSSLFDGEFEVSSFDGFERESAGQVQRLIKLDDSHHWPIKKEAIVEGQVILGGLMMVHEREDNLTCGPIMPQGGIQALEAMLYTLDWINEQQFLPDITLGAHILDDCDKDTRGLEMAVDFIRGE